MGWMETCAVNERMRFVMMVERQEETFAAVCRRFGVSRKTGYKGLTRYQARGVEGLVDRSQSPADGRGCDRRAVPDDAAETSDLGTGEGTGLGREACPRARSG